MSNIKPIHPGVRGLHHQQDKDSNMQQPTPSRRGYEDQNHSYISSPTYT